MLDLDHNHPSALRQTSTKFANNYNNIANCPLIYSGKSTANTIQKAIAIAAGGNDRTW